MLNEKKIDILKQKYKISDKELEELGFIKSDTLVISCRVTQDEYDKISKLCFDRNWYKSEIIRKYILDSIKKKKLNTNEIKKIKANKIKNNEAAYITLQLEKEDAIKFKELCKQNYVSIAATLRSIVIKICKKEGKKEK